MKGYQVMKEKIQSGIFITLVGLSGIFLVLAFINFQKQEKQEEIISQVEESKNQQISIDLNTFFDHLKMITERKDDQIFKHTTYDYLVIFVLSEKVCTPCINEVHEFVDVFEEYNSERIQSVIVVPSVNEQQVHKFLRISQFDLPSFYGKTKKLSQITQLGPMKVAQMLAVVNPTKNKITSREVLSNHITTKIHKLNLVKELMSEPEP